MHFSGKKPTSKFNLPEFDPRSVVSLHLLEPDTAKLINDSQVGSCTTFNSVRLIYNAPFQLHFKELVLMVGVQGSGKSHFVSKHLQPRYQLVTTITGN